MMKRSDHESLFIPSRQSIVAITIILLKFARIIVRTLWPLLLVFLLNRGGSSESSWWNIGITVLTGVSFVGSIIAYFKFYYHVDEDSLMISKGVIRKTKLDIPFERIQTINFEQNILHQLFNVVGVKIDTAGSVSNEVAIDALDKPTAEALRSFILEKKASLSPENFDEIQSSQEGGLVEIEEEKNILLHLKIKDLLKIGVSENHLRTAVIMLAIVGGFIGDIEDALGMDVFEGIGSWVGSGISAILFFIFIFIPFFLVLSFFISLIRTVLRYFDLKFWENKRGYKVVSGLFTRKEVSILKQKIQILEWATNPLRQVFGIFTLYLKQASSVEVNTSKTVSVPGCYESQVENIKFDYIPQSMWAQLKSFDVDKHYLIWHLLYVCFLPTIAWFCLRYFLDFSNYFFIAIYFMASVVMVILAYHKRKFHLNEHIIQSSSGIFGNREKLLQLFKIQSVSLRQSIYQRRRSLASLVLHTASGNVTVPFIPLDQAKNLQDFILYKAESINKKWM